MTSIITCLDINISHIIKFFFFLLRFIYLDLCKLPWSWLQVFYFLFTIFYLDTSRVLHLSLSSWRHPGINHSGRFASAIPLVSSLSYSPNMDSGTNVLSIHLHWLSHARAAQPWWVSVRKHNSQNKEKRARNLLSLTQSLWPQFSNACSIIVQRGVSYWLS